MFRRLLILACCFMAVGSESSAQSGQVSPFPSQQSLPPRAVGPLRVSGRHFYDAQNRVVLLRGVNLSGDAKVPPFLPCRSPADLDPLVPMGFNVVRLVFIWEAYEPVPGDYDERYLAALRSVAADANARGLHVVVDFHQDGFSRYASKGAGDGFPVWALSERARPARPDNGPKSKNWPVKMFTDPNMHKSFADFYADEQGVRTRFLAMVDRVAASFAAMPGVIGYDLLNEPHGDEADEIHPLYLDMAPIVRSRDPDAILFVQGHITTNSGYQTKLPGPPAGGVAYAPHYYNLTTIVLNRWHRSTIPIDRAFDSMVDKCEEWQSPLFIGEFGMGAEVAGTTDYIREVYERLDATLASGAQWNYTPNWTDERKDGWNQEDYNILDRPSGSPRPNFEPRPYPRATAGRPMYLDYDPPTRRQGPVLMYAWYHEPSAGATELFLPNSLFPPGSELAVWPDDVASRRDDATQSLILESAFPQHIVVTLRGPTGPH